MENTEITLWERIRPKLVQAGETTRRVFVGIMGIVAYAIEAWENTERPCSRCRRTFLNREMHSMSSELFSHRFCTECCAIIRQEQARASVARHEYQVLQRQLARAMDHECEATLTLTQ